jgi:hypothetical protein
VGRLSYLTRARAALAGPSCGVLDRGILRMPWAMRGSDDFGNALHAKPIFVS